MDIIIDFLRIILTDFKTMIPFSLEMNTDLHLDNLI